LLRGRLRKMREEEDKFFERVKKLEARIKDADLAKNTNNMRNILNVKELVQVSNTAIDSVSRDARNLNTLHSDKKIYGLVLELLVDYGNTHKKYNTTYGDVILKEQQPEPHIQPPTTAPVVKDSFLQRFRALWGSSSKTA